MLWLLLPILLTACSIISPLTPEELARLESRTYQAPKTVVQQAIIDVLKSYPMGVQDADPEKGLIVSNVGQNTMGMAGNTVGYQIKVNVEESAAGTRVIPHWWMNVSMEPLRPYLIPQPANHKPRLYENFFEDLDKRLLRLPVDRMR